jgi:hypothetical protein
MARKKETPQHSGAFVPPAGFIETFKDLMQALERRKVDTSYGLEINTSGMSAYGENKYDNSVDSEWLSWENLAKTVEQLEAEKAEQRRLEAIQQEERMKEHQKQVEQNERKTYERLKAKFEPQSPA